MLKIYTDGSALANQKNADAGYAYFIPKLNILDGGFMIGTNNIGELTAIQKVFGLIYQMKNIIEERKLEIITDSEYAILVLTRPAKLKANVELINSIKTLKKKLEQEGFEIEFRHVGAHGSVVEGQTEADTEGNATVDKIANNMARHKGNYFVFIDANGRFGFNFNPSIQPKFKD